jgi:DNA-directed RNA polymerase subunit E'/Rpb7
MNDLYVSQIVKVKINLEPNEITRDYEETLKTKVKDKYGGRCYMNGYIERQSIVITKIDTGRKIGAHLQGMITFKIEFKADFCIPKKDTIIRCQIKTLNKFGALASSPPMEIIIPKQLQQHHGAEGIEIFTKIKEMDYILVKTLGYTIEEDKLIVVGVIDDILSGKPNLVVLIRDGLFTSDYLPEPKSYRSPPKTNNIYGDNTSLNTLKLKITNFAEIWNTQIKYLISPYELIDIYRDDHQKRYNKSIVKYDVKQEDGIYPIFSRAYFKLWEILKNKDVNILDNDEYRNTPLTICNLAEGPGGFIHSLLDYRRSQNGLNWKSDTYHAITLKSSLRLQVMDWDSRNAKKYFDKMRDDGYNLNLSYGTGTGNMLDTANLRAFTKTVGSKTCELVTADGGICLGSDDECEAQEIANAKLFFTEILSALTIQKPGGTFIMKVYDIYYDITVQMIRLLSIYYDSITIIKPYTSRPANSEKYLVCQEYNPIEDEKLESLYKIFDLWVDAEPLHDYFNNPDYIFSILTLEEKNESEFVKNIKEFNENIITQQTEKINEGLALVAGLGTKKIHSHAQIKDEVVKDRKVSQKDTAIKWCQDFDIPYIADLSLA